MEARLAVLAEVRSWRVRDGVEATTRRAPFQLPEDGAILTERQNGLVDEIS